MKSFIDIILNLNKFWNKNNCTILYPIDIEIGAGTLHPITFFNGINNNKSFSFSYAQPVRRPVDSNFCKNIYKLQHYMQYQVIIKPIPKNIKKIYLMSLKFIGIDINKNCIDFINDDWNNPTLLSWGIGWEIRINGLEITQFTYFQQIGGLYCFPIMIEITYGLERIASIIQNKKIFNIIWDNKKNRIIKYKDIYFKEKEIENCLYNINLANIDNLIYFFDKYEKEIEYLLSIKKPLVFVSYEILLKLIHIFNILESRNFFSYFERQSYIIKIQVLTKNIAILYKNIYIKKNINIINEHKK